MRELRVELGPRSYPIHIGPGAFDEAGEHLGNPPGNTPVIVSDEIVAPLYLEKIQWASGSDSVLILPTGESEKTLATVGKIYDFLLQNRRGRDTSLLALGGGVVGDMVGFAAATYQRGIPFVQLPTTLLAQVDSSVGGKTGVNHPLGKNMIGAFHQPKAVIVDTDTLRTLDKRQLQAGLAEVIKYGIIRDTDLFFWLEAHLDALLGLDDQALTECISRSCQNKAEIVQADEKEAGQRALLNLGHTFGHAVETAVGYGDWLHGEAVGLGIRIAAQLSGRLGTLDHGSIERINRLLDRAGLPATLPPEIDPVQLLELMELDKKTLKGRIRYVLPTAIGSAVITDSAPQPDVLATLHEFIL
ncbi:MAG: 3-dehydroquinate synthase [Gammaproteobacteria bacterium]|nr:3-dehydroquinate synthase [Gammaproteobacteria bacterium]